MSSNREQVLQAFTAALQRDPDLTSRVYRSRSQALLRDETVGVVVRWRSDTARDIVICYQERDLIAEAIIIARGDIADQVADRYAVKVHNALMADQTLAGYAIDTLVEGDTLELNDADDSSAELTMRYRIYYRHQVAELDDGRGDSNPISGDESSSPLE